MNKIIDIASNKGLKEVEVYHKDVTSKEVRFENNNLKNINTTQNSGIGLRGIYDNKLGTCSITHDFDGEKIVDKLIESSKYSEPKIFEFPKPSEYSFPKMYDSSVEKVEVNKLVVDGQEMVNKIHQYDKNVLVTVSFGSDIDYTNITNSFGVKGEYKKSIFMAYLSGQVIDGTSFIETSCYKYGIDGLYDINAIVNTFIERLKIIRQEVGYSSQKTNVMFTPNAFVEILSTITQGVNGNAIEKGISPLCNRIGEKIFDEKINIFDDPTIDNSVDSRPFDDEGVKTFKNCIFENGVLKSYVHSLRTAIKTNSQPTGNGLRGSYDVLPSPRFNNMVIQHGNKSFEEMLEMMGNGIIIDEIIGLPMNNLINGDFGGNIHMGYKIENGKIVGRIKNAVFNSNIYKMLKSDLIALSDLNYTHPIVNNILSITKQPCVLVKDMYITVK